MTNDDQPQPSSPSHYIDNLISRTSNIINSVTLNSEIMACPSIPIIKPALTPDILSNTFGQWEPNEHFRKQDSGIFPSSNNNENDNTNNNDSLRPPNLSSSSPFTTPDSSLSRSRQNVTESHREFSSANINEEKATTFKRHKRPSDESMHESIDQKPVNLLPAHSWARVSDQSDRKDQGGRSPSSSSIRKHESSLKKAATLTRNVTIRIGRIEVKAVMPKGGFQQSLPSSPPPPQASQNSGSHLTLKDYLKQRSEGRY